MFVPRGVPHPPQQVLHALALRRAGASIPSIATQCALPQGTVSRWCRGLLPADAVLLQQTGVLRQRCDECGLADHDDVPPAAYSYLLGVYLGDGCLGPAGRSIALRVTMDAAYPGIVEEVADAILAVRGAGDGQPLPATRRTVRRAHLPTRARGAACSRSTVGGSSTCGRSCSSRGSEPSCTLTLAGAGAG